MNISYVTGTHASSRVVTVVDGAILFDASVRGAAIAVTSLQEWDVDDSSSPPKVLLLILRSFSVLSSNGSLRAVHLGTHSQGVSDTCSSRSLWCLQGRVLAGVVPEHAQPPQAEQAQDHEQ